MKRRRFNKGTIQRRRRRGTVSLEAAILTAIMIPLSVGLFFLSIKICAYLYEIISPLVGWSFL